MHLLDVVRRFGRSLADLAGVVPRLPQIVVNVRVAGAAKEALAASDEVSAAEPLGRVMIEAPTDSQAATVANRIADVVGSVLAGPLGASAVNSQVCGLMAGCYRPRPPAGSCLPDSSRGCPCPAQEASARPISGNPLRIGGRRT